MGSMGSGEASPEMRNSTIVPGIEPAGTRKRATDALGLEIETVRIVPHDVRWADLFEEARSELIAAMGQSILDVYHVGSTSVPGLCAKPVLDLLVSIADLRQGAALVPQLAELGYELRPDDIPDRLFFRRHRGSIRTHHLSLAEPTSHYYAVTIAFRDALRRDGALAAGYGDLKLQLARRFPMDRQSYQDGKSQFVLSALARTVRARPPAT